MKSEIKVKKKRSKKYLGSALARLSLEWTIVLVSVTVKYYQYLITAVLRAELGTRQPMRAIATTEGILLKGKVRVP